MCFAGPTTPAYVERAKVLQHDLSLTSLESKIRQDLRQNPARLVCVETQTKTRFGVFAHIPSRILEFHRAIADHITYLIEIRFVGLRDRESHMMRETARIFRRIDLPQTDRTFSIYETGQVRRLRYVECALDDVLGFLMNTTARIRATHATMRMLVRAGPPP